MKYLLLLFLLFSYSNISVAKMYKCISKDGKITFSDTPCMTGTQKLISGETFTIHENAKTLNFRPMAGARHLPYDKSDLKKIIDTQAKKGDPAALYNKGVLHEKLNESGVAISWFYKSGLRYIENHDVNGASDAIFAIKKIDESSWFAESLQKKVSAISNR